MPQQRRTEVDDVLDYLAKQKQQQGPKKLPTPAEKPSSLEVLAAGGNPNEQEVSLPWRLAGTGARIAGAVGSGVLGFIPTPVFTPLAGAVAGGSEALAQKLEQPEGTEIDPKRVAIESFLGMVPGNKLFKAGNLLGNVLRNAAFAESGHILRRKADKDAPILSTEGILPESGGEAVGDVLSLGIGGLSGAIPTWLQRLGIGTGPKPAASAPDPTTPQFFEDAVAQTLEKPLTPSVSDLGRSGVVRPPGEVRVRKPSGVTFRPTYAPPVTSPGGMGAAHVEEMTPTPPVVSEAVERAMQTKPDVAQNEAVPLNRWQMSDNISSIDHARKQADDIAAAQRKLNERARRAEMQELRREQTADLQDIRMRVGGTDISKPKQAVAKAEAKVEEAVRKERVDVAKAHDAAIKMVNKERGEEEAKRKIEALLADPNAQTGPRVVTETVKEEIPGGSRSLKQTTREVFDEGDDEAPKTAKIAGPETPVDPTLAGMTNFRTEKDALIALGRTGKRGVVEPTGKRGKWHIKFLGEPPVKTTVDAPEGVFPPDSPTPTPKGPSKASGGPQGGAQAAGKVRVATPAAKPATEAPKAAAMPTQSTGNSSVDARLRKKAARQAKAEAQKASKADQHQELLAKQLQAAKTPEQVSKRLQMAVDHVDDEARKEAEEAAARIATKGPKPTKEDTAIGESMAAAAKPKGVAPTKGKVVNLDDYTEAKIMKEIDPELADDTFRNLDQELQYAKKGGNADEIERIGFLRDVALDRYQQLIGKRIKPYSQSPEALAPRLVKKAPSTPQPEAPEVSELAKLMNDANASLKPATAKTAANKADKLKEIMDMSEGDPYGPKWPLAAKLPPDKVKILSLQKASDNDLAKMLGAGDEKAADEIIRRYGINTPLQTKPLVEAAKHLKLVKGASVTPEAPATSGPRFIEAEGPEGGWIVKDTQTGGIIRKKGGKWSQANAVKAAADLNKRGVPASVPVIKVPKTKPDVAKAGKKDPFGPKTVGAAEAPAAKAPKMGKKDSELFESAYDDAVKTGYKGSKESLQAVFRDKLRSARDLQQEMALADEYSPDAFLQAIRKLGGIRPYSRDLQGNKLRGDYQSVVESFGSKSGWGQRGKSSPFRDDGLFGDDMAQQLGQDKRWAELVKDENDLLDTLDDIARQGPQDSNVGIKSALEAAGVAPGKQWWQSADDAVDVLKTGEAQARLPVAGAVRDVEVKTPEFEAPFSLSREVSQQPKVAEGELFGPNTVGAAQKSKPAKTLQQMFDEEDAAWQKYGQLKDSKADRKLIREAADVAGRLRAQTTAAAKAAKEAGEKIPVKVKARLWPDEVTSEEIGKLTADEQARLLSRLVDKFKDQKGAISAELMASIGGGLVSGAVGAAMNPEAPLIGALLYGLPGAFAPAAIMAAIKHVRQGHLSPSASEFSARQIAESAQDKLKTFYYMIPDYYRASMLSHPVNLPINMWVGPWGSSVMAALTDAVQLDMRGIRALKMLMNPKEFPVNYFKNYKEAVELVGSSSERTEGVFGKYAPGPFRTITEIPAGALTAGDITARDILIRAGYTMEEARRITLTSDPYTPFGSAIANFRKSKGETGKASWLANMLVPFYRTNVNQIEQGLERFPAFGFAMNKLKNAPTPVRQQIVQQLIGGSVMMTAYHIGKATPEGEAKIMMKLLNNFGGQYGTLASVAFFAGQAERKNPTKDMGEWLFKTAINRTGNAFLQREVPQISLGLPQDIIRYITSEDPKIKLPYGTIPPILHPDEPMSAPSVISRLLSRGEEKTVSRRPAPRPRPRRPQRRSQRKSQE